jgi:hypothetical protein
MFFKAIPHFSSILLLDFGGGLMLVTFGILSPGLCMQINIIVYN